MTSSSALTPITIPSELEAEMTTPVREFVITLMDRIEELEQKLEKLTPRKSSVPLTTEHPLMPSQNEKKQLGKKWKQGGQNGHKRHLGGTGTHRGLYNRYSHFSRQLPTM